RAVEYLTTEQAFRLRLFSDSMEDATVKGRKKVVGKESKINMYGTLAEAVFTDEAVITEEVREDYSKDPLRYAKSLQQQFSRLKTAYRDHVKTLYQTGGGLKPEDQQSNLIEKIKQAFPLWDDLDGFWRELPNYNPVGVSNAAGGIDHAARAESLFRSKMS
ncbi:hypothetical protein C8R45DRAFT_767089, partial [Mycena sanguinolenta]